MIKRTILTAAFCVLMIPVAYTADILEDWLRAMGQSEATVHSIVNRLQPGQVGCPTDGVSFTNPLLGQLRPKRCYSENYLGREAQVYLFFLGSHGKLIAVIYHWDTDDPAFIESIKAHFNARLKNPGFEKQDYWNWYLPGLDGAYFTLHPKSELRPSGIDLKLMCVPVSMLTDPAVVAGNPRLKSLTGQFNSILGEMRGTLTATTGPRPEVKALTPKQRADKINKILKAVVDKKEGRPVEKNIVPKTIQEIQSLLGYADGKQTVYAPFYKYEKTPLGPVKITDDLIRDPCREVKPGKRTEVVFYQEKNAGMIPAAPLRDSQLFETDRFPCQGKTLYGIGSICENSGPAKAYFADGRRVYTKDPAEEAFWAKAVADSAPLKVPAIDPQRYYWDGHAYQKLEDKFKLNPCSLELNLPSRRMMRLFNRAVVEGRQDVSEFFFLAAEIPCIDGQRNGYQIDYYASGNMRDKRAFYEGRRVDENDKQSLDQLQQMASNLWSLTGPFPLQNPPNLSAIIGSTAGGAASGPASNAAPASSNAFSGLPPSTLMIKGSSAVSATQVGNRYTETKEGCSFQELRLASFLSGAKLRAFVDHCKGEYMDRHGVDVIFADLIDADDPARMKIWLEMAPRIEKPLEPSMASKTAGFIANKLFKKEIDQTLMTPVCRAIVKRKHQALRFLVENGASPVKECRGYSAPVRAVIEGNLEAVTHLMEHGAGRRDLIHGERTVFDLEEAGLKTPEKKPFLDYLTSRGITEKNVRE